MTYFNAIAVLAIATLALLVWRKSRLPGFLLLGCAYLLTAVLALFWQPMLKVQLFGLDAYQFSRVLSVTSSELIVAGLWLLFAHYRGKTPGAPAAPQNRSKSLASAALRLAVAGSVWAAFLMLFVLSAVPYGGGNADLRVVWLGSTPPLLLWALWPLGSLRGRGTPPLARRAA